MQAFTDVSYPENVIPFSSLQTKNGFLEMLFNEDRRMPVPEGRDWGFQKNVLIRLPLPVIGKDGAIEESLVQEINAGARKEGLGFRLAGEDVKKQLSGKPPLLHIEQDVFKVFIDKAQAEHVTQPWWQFGLRNLQRQENSLDLILPWRITEQSAATGWQVIDRNIRVRLPGLGIIDAWHSSQLLGESPVFRLVDHPLPMTIHALRLNH